MQLCLHQSKLSAVSETVSGWIILGRKHVLSYVHGPQIRE